MTLCCKFDYYAPRGIEEAVGLLREIGDGALVLAGGTDMLVRIRHRAIRPKALVGLKRIAGLNGISFDPGRGLTIGATALLADIGAHPDVQKYYPGVAAAAMSTANVQVRNMATIAGNLCNASPAADNAPTLLALQAELSVAGPEGERSVPLEAFFLGPGKTDLSPGEIVTSIFAPIPVENAGSAYLRISARGKKDCTTASVGALIATEGETCTQARIFIGACGPTPLRAPKAEQMLVGARLTDSLIESAGAQASAEALPICDVRASADYRCRVLSVLARRAIVAAMNNAKG